MLSEDEEYDESQTGKSSLVMSWLPHLLANPTAVQDADRYVDIENEDGRSDNGHSDAGSRVEDYSRGQSPEPSPTPERALTPEPGNLIDREEMTNVLADVVAEVLRRVEQAVEELEI